MVLGLITACGGAADEQPPVQPPPPPPAPTAPAPVDTAPVATAAPAPPPKPALADLEAAAVADLATNFTDASKVAAHYAPDATMFIPGMPVSTGREAIQKSLQDWLDQNTNVATANARTWTKGNQVAVHWVSTGTDKTTGKPWGVDGFSLYTFNDDGLITKDDTYFDVVTMMKQTGAYKDERPARAPSTLPTGAAEAHAAKNDATEDANVAKEKALNAAWLQGDKAAMSTFADDYAGDAYPLWETKGKKWVEENLTLSAKAQKDRSRKDLAVLGVEDFTIVEGESTYTQAGAFDHGKVHVPNLHKTLTTHGVTIHQWKDGKIVKGWQWGNAMESAQQLGIGPAAKGAAKPAAKPAAKTK
jgi:ketosteroid isomerase-like protein